MVNINLSNRAVYTIIAFLLIIIIAGVVYAVDTAEPWHSTDQIEGWDNLTDFCVFSATATGCPAGWSEATEYQDRTIRADPADLGDTGGKNNINLGQERKSGSSGEHVADNNWHTNWPPYINVLICCKD